MTSTKTYLLLIVILAALSSLSIFLPSGLPLGDVELPASPPVMALVVFVMMVVVYGGLGFLGLVLSKKIGVADMWERGISQVQRFGVPALAGVGVGIFFIVMDLILGQFHSLGKLPHPPFPTSLVASMTAGIGEEVIFRLFFISFWTWLIGNVLLRNKGKHIVFWAVSVISALAFALGHIPSVLILLGLDNVANIPWAIMIEIVLLNGVLSLFAAYYFRHYGFLAAIGIHFWTDIIWHVLYGLW